MRVLILGSAGQIGSTAMEYFARKGHVVVGFDIVNSSEEDLRHFNNQLLSRRVEECDFVLFFAFDVGGSRYLQKYQYTYEFLSNNVKIMDRVFEQLKCRSVKFIFASSQMSNMAFSPYGVLKAVGEAYTRALGGLVVKFWNVYGVEHNLEKAHVITDFIIKAKQHRRIDMLTDGTEERQFLYAEDCCAGLEALVYRYDEIPRDRELHLTSFEWSSIRRVADLIVAQFEGTVVRPGATKDVLQQGKRNEPDPFILNYWQPRTPLETGIQAVVQAMA